MLTPLVTALQIADRTLPEELASFDEIVAHPPWQPDFYEWSARVGRDVRPWRLTYYFDVTRRPPSVATGAGDRFVALCRALGLTCPPDIASLVQEDLPRRPEVLQIVVGIDAHRETGVRAKYYLVFRSAPSAAIARTLSVVRVRLHDSIDPARVYILGLDVEANGLADVKLYFRLDAARLGRVVSNVGGIAEPLRAARSVVFQQCLMRPERRQLYIHSSNPGALAGWLSRLTGDIPKMGELVDLQRAVNGTLPGLRADPWIVSLVHRDGRVDRGSVTVYFHLAPTSTEGALTDLPRGDRH